LPVRGIDLRLPDGFRERTSSVLLAIVCITSMPPGRIRAQRKVLNSSMGRVRRLIARWSCSTRLTRGGQRRKTREAKSDTRDQTKKKNETTPAPAFGAQ
jgi:hypothetical protein